MRARSTPSLPPALALIVAVALALSSGAPPAHAAEPPPREAPAGERVVLDGGHLDLAARLTGGRLAFRVKDGTVPGATVWREPSDVLLHFDPRHEIVIPPREEVPQLEGFGAPGASLWVDKDFASTEGLLWPGWNTLGILPADVTGGVEVAFSGVRGPGRFVLGRWEDDPELGLRIGVDVDSARARPGTVRLPSFTHAHPLWIFDREGVYRITLEMSATLPSGARVSDRETLAVVVGDIDPSTVEPGPGEETPGPTPPPTSPTPTSTSTPSSPVTPSASGGPTPAPTPTPSGTRTPPPSASVAQTPTPGRTSTGAAPPVQGPARTTSAATPLAPFPTAGRTSAPAPAAPSGGGRLAATGAVPLALPAGLAAAALAAGAVTVVLVRVRGKRAAR
ncbi:choice-of-anchor M domain-containing protein [Streptomyces sp. NPDC059695]|uniref:choice-of-anchor M domain-containing protein n=1 Tax=Streptomyces sp. NPDC059695 TaxID=3346910 RepID=UPI0036990720